MSVNNGNDVTNLTDGTTHASVVDSDIPGLTYYNKGKIYEVSTNAQNNLIHTEFADVSKTGDTEYSIISKNGVLTYITAIQYEPLKTSNSTVSARQANSMKKQPNGKMVRRKWKCPMTSNRKMSAYTTLTIKPEILMRFHKRYMTRMRFFSSHPLLSLLIAQINYVVHILLDRLVIPNIIICTTQHIPKNICSRLIILK